MKKKPEMKNDGHDYERFENLLREVISVPKEELKAREKAQKEQKTRANEDQFEK